VKCSRGIHPATVDWQSGRCERKNCRVERRTSDNFANFSRPCASDTSYRAFLWDTIVAVASFDLHEFSLRRFSGCFELRTRRGSRYEFPPMFPDDSAILDVSSRIRVPCREFSWSTARSSGPGGQNVNKVNSKVVLRWSLIASESVPGDVRDRFVMAYRRRMTTEGELVLSSERFRDQPKNIADCLEKLRELLQSVATAPKPRRAVKPTKGSKRRRLAAKRERTETKDRRRPPKMDE
jgi:ribosome-associated protein